MKNVSLDERKLLCASASPSTRVEANDPKNLYGLLVWDEKPVGDGPGGTSDFAARVKQLGGHLAPIINATKL